MENWSMGRSSAPCVRLPSHHVQLSEESSFPASPAASGDSQQVYDLHRAALWQGLGRAGKIQSTVSCKCAWWIRPLTSFSLQELKNRSQGSFCICAQPMKDDVTQNDDPWITGLVQDCGISQRSFCVCGQPMRNGVTVTLMINGNTAL